jgi:hypothetical protein
MVSRDGIISLRTHRIYNEIKHSESKSWDGEIPDTRLQMEKEGAIAFIRLAESSIVILSHIF